MKIKFLMDQKREKILFVTILLMHVSEPWVLKTGSFLYFKLGAFITGDEEGCKIDTSVPHLLALLYLKFQMWVESIFVLFLDYFAFIFVIPISGFTVKPFHKGSKVMNLKLMWYKVIAKFVELSTGVGWKVYGLAKILTWNAFVPSVFQCLDPIGKEAFILFLKKVIITAITLLVPSQVVFHVR